MKKVILTLTLVFIALFFTANNAKGVIFYSNGETIDVVKELPADAIINGSDHVNLGVMYKQFSIFWIPVWNYGEARHVLINDKKDTYYELEDEDVEYLKTNFDVDVPEKASINFWNKIGGKLIWAVVLVIVIFGWRSKNKDDDEEELSPETEEIETN